MDEAVEKELATEATEMVVDYIRRINRVPTSRLRGLCRILEKAGVLRSDGDHGYIVTDAAPNTAVPR